MFISNENDLCKIFNNLLKKYLYKFFLLINFNILLCGFNMKFCENLCNFSLYFHKRHVTRITYVYKLNDNLCIFNPCTYLFVANKQ